MVEPVDAPPGKVRQVGRGGPAVGQGQRFGQAKGQRRVVGPSAGGLVVGAVGAHPGHGVRGAGFAGLKFDGDTQGIAHGQAQQGGAGPRGSKLNHTNEQKGYK